MAAGRTLRGLLLGGVRLYQGQLAVTRAEKEQVVTALEQMIAQATAQQQAPPEPEDPAFDLLPAPERLLARFRLYLQSRGSESRPTPRRVA